MSLIHIALRVIAFNKNASDVNEMTWHSQLPDHDLNRTFIGDFGAVFKRTVLITLVQHHKLVKQ